VIQNHLSGVDSDHNYPVDFVIGIYPMLEDERCWFLAVDFDKSLLAGRYQSVFFGL
jgi:hypothetical protein